MLTDEHLVEAMARGDQAAFEAFVYRYHAPLQNYLERMLYDARKAEDLVQEVFVRLLKQLQQHKVPDNIRPWMYRVALNLCRDYWKSLAYRNENHLTAELPETPDLQASVVEIYERQEARKEMIAALRSLPEVQNNIVVLRFFHDLKLQEITEVLDLPLSTTKTHLYSALRKLKVLLGTSMGDLLPQGNSEDNPLRRAPREGKPHA
ncbi:RNA polymerase sigma factor [Paenibacillus lutrae]|uniref:Sigma-70 family RNA polymerase sigma factor n=1 Tax=Paenibacillus lutrae TaxID=2078573 RepID=A0A7X3K1V3_9BACL|nr:RNA polymerase sigma factor [Paenibacillus lutrae]MVP02485.1 sigma-70 family RNA polymerase sigma factor [Paenibacillus lutrae]